jgi:hypothetical protein
MLAPCRAALVMKYARRASLGYILARRLVIATRLPLSSATRSRMLLFLPIQMAWWGAPPAPGCSKPRHWRGAGTGRDQLRRQIGAHRDQM